MESLHTISNITFILKLAVEHLHSNIPLCATCVLSSDLSKGEDLNHLFMMGGGSWPWE